MNRQEINSQLRRTNIRGKDYIDVSQRVDAFWQLFPDWSLTTEKTADDGQRVDFTAKAIDESGRIRSTGHAYEVYGRGVNSTSAVENCETSAVGRCLGFLGIGIEESVASAEEVSNAIAQQAKPIQADAMVAERKRAWHNIKTWAASSGGNPNSLLEGVKMRPEYEDSYEFWSMIADEFEQ